MALRRASKHYFSSFSFFFFGKREKGRNVSENILFMDVDIVFCDVLIIRRYVCIFYHAAYIAFVYVYVCTDLKHNLMWTYYFRMFAYICFRKGYIVLSYAEIDAKTSFWMWTYYFVMFELITTMQELKPKTAFLYRVASFWKAPSLFVSRPFSPLTLSRVKV